jgi:hypothetical protein
LKCFRFEQGLCYSFGVGFMSHEVGCWLSYLEGPVEPVFEPSLFQ